MAGQFRVRAGIVCGAAAAGREDAGGRLYRDKRGVLVLVHDDLLEQGTVQDAAFRRFALAVEVAEIGEDVGDLVEASAGASVVVARLSSLWLSDRGWRGCGLVRS